MAKVKCPICEQMFNKETTEWKKVGNRYYHLDCYNKTFGKQIEIYNYLEKVWGSCNAIKIKKQIMEYKNTKGYNETGILQALQFFFEVKNGDRTKYRDTIGIVPYVYDDAQRYFKQIEKKDKAKQERQKIFKEKIEDYQEDNITRVRVTLKTRQKHEYELEGD